MDQADVVLIGDLYVEGWYVSDDQTVATRKAKYSDDRGQSRGRGLWIQARAYRPSRRRGGP